MRGASHLRACEGIVSRAPHDGCDMHSPRHGRTEPGTSQIGDPGGAHGAPAGSREHHLTLSVPFISDAWPGNEQKNM